MIEFVGGPLDGRQHDIGRELEMVAYADQRPHEVPAIYTHRSPDGTTTRYDNTGRRGDDDVLFFEWVPT